MKRPLCLIALCLTAMILFILKIRPPTPEPHLPDEDSTVCAEGRITDKYYKNQSYYLNLSNARLSRDELPKNKTFNIIVKLQQDYPDLTALPEIGKSCMIRGKPYYFDGAVNPGQFDLAAYEKLRGIDLELIKSEILCTKGRADPLKELLIRLKGKWSAVYDALYDEEEAGVIKAMVLGDKNSLEPEIKGLYQRAGISHVLCISGLHISLIGCALYELLKRLHLPRAPAGGISLIVLILYGLMTGMGISTKRAIIMFGVILLAELAGRTYDLLSSLALAGTLILLGNPLSAKDSGFMLSFGAVLGAGLVKPVVDQLIPKGGKAADVLKLSFSINIFTLPIVLYFFYQIPVYSVLFNLILIPLMGILLVFAILSGITGLLFLPLSVVLSFPCKILLFLYETLCRLNDALPGSVLLTGRPGTGGIIAYYMLLGFTMILIFRRKRERKKSEYCLMFLSAAAAVFLLMFRISPELSVTMLDIGQGDCSILRTRQGKTIMIDCGSSDESRIAKYRVIPFLRSEGRDTVDLAVMTHADEDHISGFVELFELPQKESVRIRTLLMPDIGNKDEAYLALAKKAEKAGCRVQMIRAGMGLSMGDLKIECLHPDQGYICRDRNEYSTVLSVTFRDFSALFTGDIQEKGEEILTQRIRRHYTLLKCAHHGSENSTPNEFLQRVKPELTFISAGRDNRYGHPHRALLERLRQSGTKIYVTNRSGAIILKTNGKCRFVDTYLKYGPVDDAESAEVPNTFESAKKRR